MESKESKITQIEELITRLGVDREELIARWSNTVSLNTDIDISQIQVGMFWYEDNSFSFQRMPNKRIKAIVELIEGNIVYGDLTASEIVSIKEQDKEWHEIKCYIEHFPYCCSKNEKIVQYSIVQLENVYKQYKKVRKSFKVLSKPYRKGYYWSSTSYDVTIGWGFIFDNGFKYECMKNIISHIRPVIALKI